MNYFAIINSLISMQQGLIICLNILAWLFMVGGAGVGLNINSKKTKILLQTLYFPKFLHKRYI